MIWLLYLQLCTGCQFQVAKAPIEMPIHSEWECVELANLMHLKEGTWYCAEAEG
jgi:hypothetical protein